MVLACWNFRAARSHRVPATFARPQCEAATLSPEGKQLADLVRNGTNVTAYVMAAATATVTSSILPSRDRPAIGAALRFKASHPGTFPPNSASATSSRWPPTPRSTSTTATATLSAACSWDCRRANDDFVSHPTRDGKNLIDFGGSQGGFLSIVTTALDPRQTAFVAAFPAYCDVSGDVHGTPAAGPGGVSSPIPPIPRATRSSPPLPATTP